MGIFIDISIILLMILFIYFGYKKGLIKVAISFLSIILSILIALIFYKPISQQIIVNTEIDEAISDSIYSKIEDVDFKNISEEDKKDNGIISIAEKYINEAIQNSTENIGKYIADNLTLTIIEILVFIGLIILLRILLLILNILGNAIGNIPIIKQFNKSGGTIYGVIEGFVIINVIFAILYIVNPICGNGQIQKSIEQSYLGEMIYKNDFITNTIIK